MTTSQPWYDNSVFYELYIRAYKDNNGDGNGDFRGAIEKLDHIKSLGVDCIWVMPHYPSPLLDDGYDISNYMGVHPDYGNLDDFKAFLDAAHARGLKVITDMVMNHTSDQHPWFQAARQDKNSPYRDYYVWSDTGTEYAGARIIFLDTEPSNWTYDEVAGQYFWHRFYRCQPDLNYDNPKVHEEMFKAMRFWLDMGIDGFRVDAIPYLYEREGTNCENLPETHDFLKKMRRTIDEEYPGTLLIAEANQWPEDLLPYFGTPEEPEFQVCFHFPIMPRLYMALKKGDKTPIVDILNQTPAIPPGAQWMTFLRNHDELTLEMVTPEEREWMWQQYAPDPRMKLNLGIRRRQAPLLDHDKRKWFLLNALFLSLPGLPIIYYGDEIGMGDNIWLPDRHGCRTPMQWNDGKNGGFSDADKTYFPVNADYERLNVAAQEADPESYLNLTRFLIQTRQSQPALQHGEFEFVETGNKEVLAFRRFIDNDEILCVFNLTMENQSFELDTEFMTDLLANDFNWTNINVYGAHWLKKVKTTGETPKLLEKLQSLGKKEEVKTILRIPEHNVQLPPFDLVGLILEYPLKSFRYRLTPTNALTFAWTGVDGEHFSLLVIDGEITDTSPVIATVPMALGLPPNVVVGENLRDFMNLGCHIGFDKLASLPYAEDRNKAFAELDNPKTWVSADVNSKKNDQYQVAEKQILRLLIEQFDLKPPTNIELKLKNLQERYMSKLVPPWDL